MFRMSKSGVDQDETKRIIGVEFTLVNAMGNREELFMLTPPGGFFDLFAGDATGGYPGAPQRLAITVHTSHGDRNVEVQL